MGVLPLDELYLYVYSVGMMSPAINYTVTHVDYPCRNVGGQLHLNPAAVKKSKHRHWEVQLTTKCGLKDSNLQPRNYEFPALPLS